MTQTNLEQDQAAFDDARRLASISIVGAHTAVASQAAEVAASNRAFLVQNPNSQTEVDKVMHGKGSTQDLKELIVGVREKNLSTKDSDKDIDSYVANVNTESFFAFLAASNLLGKISDILTLDAADSQGLSKANEEFLEAEKVTQITKIATVLIDFSSATIESEGRANNKSLSKQGKDDLLAADMVNIMAQSITKTCLEAYEKLAATAYLSQNNSSDKAAPSGNGKAAEINISAGQQANKQRS